MNNKTVLIVEDSPEMIKAYESFFEIRGYGVTSASSARDALKYKENQFTLAIFDGLEGQVFDVIDQLKAGRKIILSGNNSIVSRAKNQGLEAYDKLNGMEALKNA